MFNNIRCKNGSLKLVDISMGDKVFYFNNVLVKGTHLLEQK
jgi:hypothetical protein